ncbi:MAG TPA: efflux RND transporter periplasmic adaptor subunit [Terriglobales bacterium]|nr:efflux RND transporter periplasmic adaptor subunit [Terriglobales bacterium]
MLIVAGTAVAVILLAAFASLRGNEVPVRADQVLRENIVNTIATNGKVRPVDNFEAHAPTATTVRRVLVHEGDRVKAGQLLLELDDTEARTEAAKALARLKAAEADLHSIEAGGTHEEVLTTQSELVKAHTELEAANRNLTALQQLEQRGAASAAEVQDAHNRLKRAQAEVNLLEQKETSRYSRPEIVKVKASQEEAQTSYQAAQDALLRSNVRAPRDGIVYSLPVRVGAYVNPGDLLVQVADLRTVQVVGYVDEPEIGRLAPGLKVTVTWDALPGRTWQGTVTRIPTTVSQLGTRSVGDITCTVDNGDLKLLPNVNVNVTITTAQDNGVLTVAREAVRQDNGKQYVFEIVNGELKRRNITTSVSNPTRIEIISGLPDNSLVALSAVDNHPLTDGLAVRVVQR